MTGEDLPAEFQGLSGGLFCENLFMFCLGVVILCSTGVTSLGIMNSLTNNYLQVTNDRNVMYYYSQNGTVEPSAVLLIPEFVVEVGMLYFTIGAMSFSRKQCNVLPLPPFSSQEGPMQLVLSEDISRAYLKVRNDALQFGYAAAETCGGYFASKIMHKSRFVFAATIIGTLCGLGIIILASIFLFHLKTRHDMLKTQVCVKQKYRLVRLTGEEEELKIFIRLHETERRLERYVILVLFLLSVVGTIFLVTAEVVERHLRASALKCGRSFCGVYEDAMSSFLQVLGASGHSFSCHVGYSSVVLFVVAILSTMLFLLALLLAAVHFVMRHTSVRLDHVGEEDEKRSSDGRELSFTCAGNAPIDLCRFSNGSMDVTNPVAHHRAAKTASEEERYGDYLFVYSTETESVLEEVVEPGTVREDVFNGERCALLEREEAARVVICREHDFVFRTQFCWVKEKLWQGEMLCMLHQYSFNWYIGRMLDLHVDETYSRQTLLRKSSEKLLGKFRKLEKRFHMSEPILRSVKKATAVLHAAYDGMMRSASHYAVKDDICRYGFPTDWWLNNATKALVNVAMDTKRYEL
ncbi:hypothetical protein TraAM80_02469 [Trypanosoma rangeli]|uniref:Uncharacterized protein n=1 Tax=Trypanosoma rangeli TaxID=5698 RepID=A0A3R7KLM7_TRYRA|nr:uncharacterized protein TraAM80_02469 [Trypanosoma rangeli]RNF08923.1 hypothetical protein TraAM80_02469 [Trypanosoma rangeli]|eukprot:RNF08923.1 hypothetical protein TraAM80_02469 [Trypanosoma rangeli]